MEEKKKSVWGKIAAGAKATWDYLDGKKTAIGSAMMFVSGAFKEHTVAHQALYWGGFMLSGGGVAHKVKKGDFKK